jgi:hypothetical protein
LASCRPSPTTTTSSAPSTSRPESPSRMSEGRVTLLSPPRSCSALPIATSRLWPTTSSSGLPSGTRNPQALRLAQEHQILQATLRLLRCPYRSLQLHCFKLTVTDTRATGGRHRDAWMGHFVS